MRVSLLVVPCVLAATGPRCEQTYSMPNDPCNNGANDEYPLDCWKVNWMYPDADKPQYAGGYRNGQFHYDPNEPPFCLSVSGTANTMVKIIVEADTRARVCITDQNWDSQNRVDALLDPVCGNGVVTACLAAPETGNFNLQIDCSGESCAPGSTAFKYKVFHSNRRDNPALQVEPATQNLDMWCMMLEGTEQLKLPSEFDDDTSEQEVPEVLEVDDGGSAGYTTAPDLLLAGAVAVMAAAQL